MSHSLGQAIDRVDGRLKVTGGATYSADTPVTGVAHAVIVGSTIAKGSVARIDASKAEAAPGVFAVMTHLNAPRLPEGATKKTHPGDRVLQILQDGLVRYSGQPVAVVVADTLDRAIGAASMVAVTYEAAASFTDMERGTSHGLLLPLSNGKSPDSKRGDFDKGLRGAAKKVEATYTTPVEHHNPMETHATVAVWNGPEQLTIYDSTQGVFEALRKVSLALGLDKKQVRVLSPFVGGGFGCKGSVWSHVVLAAMAARHVGKPVKLSVTRPQMFDFVGHRPGTIQKLVLGASRDGKLTAVSHEGISSTSQFDQFVEPVAVATRMLYACPNVVTTHRVVRVDAGTPTFARAPGESVGTFAIESAMDELAVALGMDPIELRLKNYAERDPHEDKPWSSKSLKECYLRGAERFGWKKRTPAPRSMRDGKWLIGMGMASATYPMNRSPAGAIAKLLADGTVLVQSGTQDVGPGTYTAMTQIAADTLGIPTSRVKFELGDTRMPMTPVSGGSMTAASTGSAVKIACENLKKKLIDLSRGGQGATLGDAKEKDLVADDGKVFLRADPKRSEDYAAILGRHGLKQVEEKGEAKPGSEKEEVSMHSFGAQFAEVRVEPDLGLVRVSRWTGVFAAGRIINPKLARSQFLGGVVWGIGMALTEHSVMDHKRGRFMTRDLADYHVPVHADVPDLDVSWIEETDNKVNPVGIKGIGELGVTGAAAAIANAVFHATGKRIRDLPITVDKIL